MPLSACGVTSGRCLVMRVGDEEPVPVTLGLRNESEAEVLDGLQEGDRIRLGWLEEPGHMISVLAGNQPLPEDVSEAILSEGEDYGTRTMPIVIPPSGTGAEGTEPGGATGREGSRSDPSRIAAEVEAQREQIRQQMETAGEQPSGRSGMRAAPDSTQLANLRRRAEALPEGLRAELLQFVEGGGSDVRSLSQALRDSLRAWGIFGGGRGSRGGGEIPPSGEEISPVNSESSGGIPPGQGVIER
jgi:hypothetical protein